MKTNFKKEEWQLYMAGWAFIAFSAALGVYSRVSGVSVYKILPGCVFHHLTGYYCPGCGGTRAVKYLLEGQWMKSFYYHPFVLYAAVIVGWYMCSHTVEFLSGRKIKIGMHFRYGYLWLALGIIIVQFLVKNIALLCFQVDLLA